MIVRATLFWRPLQKEQAFFRIENASSYVIIMRGCRGQGEKSGLSGGRAIAGAEQEPWREATKANNEP